MISVSSDYIIYVDESGDHSLAKINPEYPLFVLALCIVKKSEYADQIVPAMQRLKHRWFGHDLVVLHEKEIIRKENAFSFLQNSQRYTAFMSDLTHLVASAPITVISTVIRKEALSRRYHQPMNPYDVALLFCLERARDFLVSVGDADRVTHLIAEARSPREKSLGREDGELATTFKAIEEGRHPLQTPRSPRGHFALHFAHKQANIPGLQIADLIARPIGLSVLRPGQPNRAFDVISSKFWRSFPDCGLKVFP